MEFQSADWYKEHALYDVIHDSFVSGEVPYHTNLAFHGTNRFMALPEVVFSPQIFVLAYTNDIGIFFLIHTFFLFTVGFVGCLFLQRMFNLSTMAFSILVFLFSFNGYITSHLSVGHTMWGGYFFLPWLFWSLLRMTREKRSARANALAISMVLFLIWLQGSLHILVGCLVYLVVFSLFNHRYIRSILFGIGFAVFLNLYRLFPAVISFSDHKLYFQSGYPTIRDLVDALTMIKLPSIDMVAGLTGALYWWELDVFVGVIGTGFLLYFGLYLVFRMRTETINGSPFVFPNLIVALFAMNHFYGVIATLQIPLASVERVPSRMLIIPLVSVLIFACVKFDEFFEDRRHSMAAMLLAVAALIQTVFELKTHLRFWNVASINAALPPVPELQLHAVTVLEDQLYVSGTKVAYLVSAVALGVWAILAVFPGRRSEAS